MPTKNIGLRIVGLRSLRDRHVRAFYMRQSCISARRVGINTCGFCITPSLWLVATIGFNKVWKVGSIKNSQVIRQADFSRGFGCFGARFSRLRRQNLTRERLNPTSYAGYRIVRGKITRFVTLITDVLRLHLTLKTNQVSHNSALVNKHS